MINHRTTHRIYLECQIRGGVLVPCRLFADLVVVINRLSVMIAKNQLTWLNVVVTDTRI